MSEYVVGITGASGSIYGIRLVEELLAAGHRVELIVTDAGEKVMKEELRTSGRKAYERLLAARKNAPLRLWRNDDFTAPFMSGSNAFEAVVVIPCSVGKLAAIANGLSGNLLERTADVALKEKRKLVLVLRETPLSPIHIENMLKVARAGAHILPAMPAFYHRPKTIDDMVDFIVGKVLNLLGIEHKLLRGWKAG